VKSTKGRYSFDCLVWCITCILRMSSNTLFTLSFWPSIWGWWAVLNANSVPKPANKLFQKLGVNLASRSETMVLGRPCNLKIYFIKKLATPMVLKVDLIGMKWATLLKLSTTTMIASCFFIVFGKLVTNSMEIFSHFHYGICKGCHSPVGCLCSTFTCWHSKHFIMYSIMSYFIFGKVKSFLNNFKKPWWPIQE
jgi:hypothetical protein